MIIIYLLHNNLFGGAMGERVRGKFGMAQERRIKMERLKEPRER